MGKTSIEWCSFTFNPWLGCTKVSPACDHCYAEAMMDTRYGRVRWGAGEDRVRTSPANWKLPLRWNAQAQAAGSRPFVFCASLADVFDNEVNPLWRVDLFRLIHATPSLIWLLLTKRIGNVVKMIPEEFPGNVAIGATMANQEEYDRDRMKLWEARRRLQPLFTFGSFEPLLGPVILDRYAPDWVIVGGESGPKARMMNPEWAEGLLDASAKFRRAFFMKQMSGKAPIPEGLQIRTFPDFRKRIAA
jgi:protein gp37